MSHGALQFMAYEELKKGYSWYFGTPIQQKLVKKTLVYPVTVLIMAYICSCLIIIVIYYNYDYNKRFQCY